MPITKEYITLNIEDIIPYENNPRINDDAVAGVVESIKQCGELDPIEVDENNIILSGHTRLKAYNQLGYDSISVLRITGLTEPQKRKYRLLTNKTGEVAGWDFDKLEIELDGLDFDGFDFGFDVDLPSLEEDDQKEVVEDDYDEEPPTEPKAKLGDLWQLGSHRLICGDSTDIAVIDRLMDGVKANILLTDPPYGISKDKGIKTTYGTSARDAYKYDGDWDSETPDRGAFLLFLEMTDNAIIFGGNYLTDKLPLGTHWIVWDKIGDIKFNNPFSDCELAWTNFGKIITKKYTVIQQGFVADEKEKRVHPTQKPVKLMAQILEDYSDDGDNILDAFGGSGSTLIACEQLNRKCYMAELDPKYVSVILQRYINFKGSDADVFLLKDGKKIPYSKVKS